MSSKVKKCLVCEHRPAANGEAYCDICSRKITAENLQRDNNKPVHYLTYRGHVVGLFRNDRGTLTPRLLKRKPEKLPKCRTLDLNVYQQGFTREMIKTFKKTVIQLSTVKLIRL